jgi:ABC-type transport system involved in Fe-S cluster assembly fused permease/ATPase subunit
MIKNSLIPLMREFWRPRFRGRVVGAAFFLLLAKVFNVSAPLFYKHAVDALTPNASSLALVLPLGFILAYGAARVGNIVFSELQLAIYSTALYRIMREVAVRIFGHLHGLSLRFHLERRTGGLSRVIERGVGAIEQALDMLMWIFVPSGFELLLTLGLIAWLFGWLMAAITAVSIVLYVAFTIKVSSWRMDIRREAVEENTKANAHAVDSLLNYETVKYFGNEAHELARYDLIQSRYEANSVKSRWSLSFLNCGQSAIIAIGLVLVMGLSAQRILQGQATIGDFVLINTYMLQLYMPLNFLGTAYRTLTQALVDMEKMFILLEEKSDVKDAPNAPALIPGGGRIVFDNVHFGYDERRMILKGVSFTAEPGQRVAIVGPSGAGKSTIARLLFRFYDVTSGTITIDGQTLSAVTQNSLRAAIGIVPQDTVLFNESIAYNIGYGRPDASLEDIHEAAKLARIHEFCLSLPDGYDTVVGERGLKLSGGEKQRVAIARTILKRPRLLIFDEATSALDTRTEKEIQASLDAVSQGHTTLVIAHRLSTIADADLILVLDDGRIVEQGQHDTLLIADGLYARMWRRQLEADAEEKNTTESLTGFS